jgi:hypothetical protein
VIAVLTDSETPRRYWSDLKRKLKAEGSQLYEKIVQPQKNDNIEPIFHFKGVVEV